MASDNKSLGRFILEGIPPAPRGVPQVEVSFDIDANGILHVTAKDKASGKTNSIKITASSGLSKEEVEKMKQEAAQHEAEDKTKKDAVDAKIGAEQLVYSAEKTLKEYKEKVPAETVKTIEEKITALKAVKDGVDIGAIRKASDELNMELSKIGELMAKAGQNAGPANDAGSAQGNPGAGAEGTTGSNGDQKGPEGDVKDAEFKEKK